MSVAMGAVAVSSVSKKGEKWWFFAKITFFKAYPIIQYMDKLLYLH